MPKGITKTIKSVSLCLIVACREVCFFAAAAVAGFLVPWAEEILRITLGSAYVGGATTLMIMLFYPMHQSMGQINGIMAYATARVSVYVKLGIAFLLSSVVVTYFVLANTQAPLPGLDLGSIGLAGKMVVMQIISVNALAFYIAHSLDIKYDWVFQLTAPLFCVAAGLLAFTLSHALFDTTTQIWFTLPVAGFAYSILLLALLWLSPNIAGLSRPDLLAVANWLKGTSKIRRFRRG